VTALDLDRWQFAITTIFHFLFVPVSIGLALYVAICQTLHYRTGKATGFSALLLGVGATG
jgi:cytochrome bd ubiquinol oxidase subunit I